MKTINHKELVEMLINAKGCNFVGVTAETAVKMNKGGRAQSNTLYGEKVTKLVKMQMQLGLSYEHSMNLRLEKNGEEGDFKAGELPYGCQWIKYPFVYENPVSGQKYIRLYDYEGNKKSKTYMVNGKVASEGEMDIIKEYEVKSKPKEGQLVRLYGYKIEGIKEFNYNGESYKVEG